MKNGLIHDDTFLHVEKLYVEKYGTFEEKFNPLWIDATVINIVANQDHSGKHFECIESTTSNKKLTSLWDTLLEHIGKDSALGLRGPSFVIVMDDLGVTKSVAVATIFGRALVAMNVSICHTVHLNSDMWPCDGWCKTYDYSFKDSNAVLQVKRATWSLIFGKKI